MPEPRINIRLNNHSISTSTDTALVIDIESKEFPSVNGESILESLERANVDMNYNCREGYCGVCRTKLLAGSVEYKIEPLAFIDDDEILTCCTKPTSNIKIRMEY